ncbi:probable protein phosphatase 2C 55 [Andrographis paniculata]|uniref:probable protein phosphatase 2C 55 n=1 Tax=Andrographis paniculata TaxID=175694 RepID=UPI0021E87390|nr:probable protein phosphatase 2C 55 [Andrographis paniculata]
MAKKFQTLKMEAGAYCIPKRVQARRPSGEDAHFFCSAAQVIGVADGVGGWSRKGIDAGKYAEELMTYAADAVEGKSPGEVNPRRVLEEAYLNAAAEGSSTACIIAVAGRWLRAANLGDSGFVVVRNGGVLYRSPAQQHYFNCPYQMGCASGQSPDDAEELVVALRAGDVIVAGTDGLFDNMFAWEIAELVSACLRDEAAAEVTANAVATAARRRSEGRELTPFELAASIDAGLESYIGGKIDDITVVVAYIIE